MPVNATGPRKSAWISTAARIHRVKRPSSSTPMTRAEGPERVRTKSIEAKVTRSPASIRRLFSQSPPAISGPATANPASAGKRDHTTAIETSATPAPRAPARRGR